MKTLRLLLSGLLCMSALVFASCDKDEDKDSTSIEGRWNISKTPDDYSFSLIFKGNKLDVYIIAWGEHVEGTYTYANDEVTFNITKQSKAWANVSFDDKGNMITYSWMAGNMNQETFELAPGYAWYPVPDGDPQDVRDMLGKFTFKLTSSTTAETSLMGGAAHKAK